MDSDLLNHSGTGQARRRLVRVEVAPAHSSDANKLCDQHICVEFALSDLALRAT